VLGLIFASPLLVLSPTIFLIIEVVYVIVGDNTNNGAKFSRISHPELVSETHKTDV
jgi:hypothetical protein